MFPERRLDDRPPLLRQHEAFEFGRDAIDDVIAHGHHDDDGIWIVFRLREHFGGDVARAGCLVGDDE